MKNCLSSLSCLFSHHQCLWQDKIFVELFIVDQSLTGSHGWKLLLESPVCSLVLANAEVPFIPGRTPVSDPCPESLIPLFHLSYLFYQTQECPIPSMTQSPQPYLLELPSLPHHLHLHSHHCPCPCPPKQHLTLAPSSSLMSTEAAAYPVLPRAPCLILQLGSCSTDLCPQSWSLAMQRANCCSSYSRSLFAQALGTHKSKHSA